MKKYNYDLVDPNISNFINSIRDVGYNFNIAVSDLIDNCLDASARNIEILGLDKPELLLEILDDGYGMEEKELKEAMRLATKDSKTKREQNELGKFGLGLKTASFSQCKKLTVVSKKNGKMSARTWDLDFVTESNEWRLINTDINEVSLSPLIEKLKSQEHGTLVILNKIDRYTPEEFNENLLSLRKHISLVFHRLLEEKKIGMKKLSIKINDNILKPFNPFNEENGATQEFIPEEIYYKEEVIKIKPYILPHHSKMTQSEYEKYATDEGYLNSQGFYLYRANRLLIYGTWWGIKRNSNAHQLVRIAIDIPNTQDDEWGIDIKKSTAKPAQELKNKLKQIVENIAVKGSRPYTGRGKAINNSRIIKFWELIPENGTFRFGINKSNPIINNFISGLENNQKEEFSNIIDMLEGYLPLESIQANLMENPKKIEQKKHLDLDKMKIFIDEMRAKNVDEEFIEKLIKSEIYRDLEEIK